MRKWKANLSNSVHKMDNPTNAGKGGEKKRPSSWVLEISIGVFKGKKLKIDLPYDPDIAL